MDTQNTMHDENRLKEIGYVYLTPTEYTQLMKISKGTFWRYVKEGRINVERYGPKFIRVKTPRAA